MAWKATGHPRVRRQRDKWVARVDGVDTATAKHRPRQIGTYKSQRSAHAAAREMKTEDAVADKGTVSWPITAAERAECDAAYDVGKRRLADVDALTSDDDGRN